MKKVVLSILLAVLLALGAAGLAWAASGGVFDVPWFKLTAGGGRWNGGAFQVNGAIGQLDAGAANGGAFTIRGGILAIPAQPATAIPSERWQLYR